MRLENMPEHAVEHFEIPTGIPLVFEFVSGVPHNAATISTIQPLSPQSFPSDDKLDPRRSDLNHGGQTVSPPTSRHSV